MFVKKGSEFFIQGPDERDIYETLPAQIYTVHTSMTVGYYLSIADPFELPKRVYGDTMVKADRIVNTFQVRPRSTGVLLAGEKGSGKTLLSKVICNKAIAAGMPVLLITSPHRGDSFLSFLEEIKQDCVILFDEFEKVYPTKEEQAPLLTIFDGIFSNKKLFLLTVNDTGFVTGPMKNRPGRIFYNINFQGLDSDFIQEYCEENLEDKTKIPQIHMLGTLFRAFSFDMLQAIVEELNRYGENPADLLDILNTKPESGGSKSYNVELTVQGVLVAQDRLYDPRWDGNPLIRSPYIEYKVDPADDDVPDRTAIFTVAELVKMNVPLGVYSYKNADGDTLTLTRVKDELPSYTQFLS